MLGEVRVPKDKIEEYLDGIPLPQGDGIIRASAMGHLSNYDAEAVSAESGLDCSVEESFTQQQFAEECDINTIVRRFGLTGQLPQNLRMPVSGDFTEVPDYQSALNLVLQAQEEFLKVPAETRARFQNDPQQLMNFLSVEKNRDEAIRLGLIEKPAEKTRDVVQAVDELAAALKPKV